MANALSQDPKCCEQIEEEKTGKILELSGESSESPEKVKGGKIFGISVQYSYVGKDMDRYREYQTLLLALISAGIAAVEVGSVCGCSSGWFLLSWCSASLQPFQLGERSCVSPFLHFVERRKTY